MSVAQLIPRTVFPYDYTINTAATFALGLSGASTDLQLQARYKGVMVQADPANSANVEIGRQAGASRFVTLTPGERVFLQVASPLFVWGSATGQNADVSFWV